MLFSQFILLRNNNLYYFEIKPEAISNRLVRYKDMKKLISIISLLCLLAPLSLSAQERTVQNRPYTDLRKLHFGVLVGTHLQDIEFVNAGPTVYIDDCKTLSS